MYNRVLWLFIHLVRILLILVTNNTILEEKCRTTFALNQLHITSKEMERAINRFLLKLMVHQSPVLFCGIIELDLFVVCGIVGAVTNYFIFLVQIDLGTTTISDFNITDTPTNNRNI
nr:putative gustatory receptor 59e [Bactrocera oleae]